MPIQLTQEQETLVDQIVSHGDFDDVEQALDGALRLLIDQQERLARLRAELEIGEEQERRGELIDFTPERMEHLKRQARENARAGEPIKDAVRP